MTDRDRLIELITRGEEFTPCWNHEDIDCTDRKCGVCEREAIADHLIANGVTVQRWIPVTERLPEDEVEVLIATDYGGQVVGIYDSKRKEWKSWSDEYREYYSLCGWMGEVTHWMPLPKTPKEEA